MPERHRSCKGIWDNTDAVWTEAMNVNVLATWRLAELTTEDMQKHGKGSLICVESCGRLHADSAGNRLRREQGGVLFVVRSLAKALADRNAIKRFGAADEALGAAILPQRLAFDRS